MVPPQTDQWIDSDSPVTIIFYNNAETLYSGECWSQRIGHQGLGYAIIALILILAFFGLNKLVHQILGLSSIFRYILAFLLLLPPGLLMGLPLPLGMQYLLKSPVQHAYAWAVNGCASVLTSILAAQITFSLGIPTIMACAASAYLLAFLSALQNHQSSDSLMKNKRTVERTTTTEAR